MPNAAHIERWSIPEPNSGCWLWTGGTNGTYGLLFVSGKKSYAHRASYEVYIGPIPHGYFVCHKCDVPICVNPEHLFLGTHSDNMRDRNQKGRTSRLRGERGPSAKLTADQARSIFLDKRRQYDIADAYGINQSTVSGIKRRKNWTQETEGLR